MNEITRIGMVVAMEKEVTPFLKEIASECKSQTVNGFSVSEFKIKNKTIYLVKSGIGEIYAAAATQLLITKFNVQALFNFGVVGSLTDEIGIAETVFVDGVVHYDFDLSPIDPVKTGQYPGYDEPVIKIDNDLLSEAKKLYKNVPTVVCASADKFVADENIKKVLNETYGAKVCDMECAAVLLTAINSGVPVLIIKAVSDGKGGADEFNKRVNAAACVYIGAIKKITEEI